MIKELNQITVDCLIEKLQEMPVGAPVGFAPGIYAGLTDSYRGYYEDLAIEIVTLPRATGALLKELQDKVGTKITGYKGGDYTVKANTALWAANWGSTGPAIIGAELTEDGWVRLITQADD